MSDRICIHSKGEKNARLSAQNLVSCCITCGFGCGGGFPGAAWHYWVRHGIVTGGAYGSSQVRKSILIWDNMIHDLCRYIIHDFRMQGVSVLIQLVLFSVLNNFYKYYLVKLGHRPRNYLYFRNYLITIAFHLHWPEAIHFFNMLYLN